MLGSDIWKELERYEKNEIIIIEESTIDLCKVLSIIYDRNDTYW